MYDIAAQVTRWLDANKSVHVAQIVATRGFSSSDPSAALAWTDDGEVAGSLLPGIDADLPATGAQLAGRLVELGVSDVEAVAAGLSCGGVATVFVQDAAAYPSGFWARLERREPLCVLNTIVGNQLGRSEVYGPSEVREAARLPGAQDVARLFALGSSAAALTTEGDTSVAAVTLWPHTSVLIVGGGTIADSLAGMGGLLGWTCTVTNDAAVAAEIGAALTESDAVVVLSHDRDVDVPALAAVLAGRAGYVGALGSRPTQAARREGLTGRGVVEPQIARIHGPAGLDLGAHTPAEIAVSIVAEILSHRSGTSGGSISRRQGPVHASGVKQAPRGW